MRILVYEHVCGGGFAGQPLPTSLLCEGYGMLRGLAEDFKAAGHEVSVLLDSRLETLGPWLEADHIVEVASPAMAGVTLSLAAESADAAYAVAPEADDVLRTVVERIEDAGAISLNSKTASIAQASDKEGLASRAESLGLHFPRTLSFKAGDSADEVALEIEKTSSFPAVVKPLVGAGFSGFSVVQDKARVSAAITKAIGGNYNGRFIAQELIQGVPASVSLICNGKEALPVSLNQQNVNLAGPHSESSYNGGSVPLDHPMRATAFEGAKRLVESFDGLRGYVGVDFVLSENDAFVMEVNPRLTTSYVGLRKIVDFNVAQAILDSVSKRELPNAPRTKGYSCFSKHVVPNCSEAKWQKASLMEAIVSPPFPLANSTMAFAVLESHAASANEAERCLSEAKKQLSQICKGDERAR